MCHQAFAQTPFPEGVNGLGSKEVHDSMQGKMFATKNTNGKGQPVGDTIEFKTENKVVFTEGTYSNNFVFDKDAYRDDLTWQGGEGRYCSLQHKWCMELRTQGENLLTRWGPGDGVNKPILVWAPYVK